MSGNNSAVQCANSTGQFATSIVQCATSSGPCPTSAGQCATSIIQCPTSAGQFPTSAGQFPTSAGQFQTSAGLCPTSADQFPTSAGLYATSAGQCATSAGQSVIIDGQSATSAGQSVIIDGQSATTAGQSATSAGQSATSAGQCATSAGQSANSTGECPTSAGQSATIDGQSATSDGKCANNEQVSAPEKRGRKQQSKNLTRETKELIIDLYNFMKREAREGPILLKRTQVRLSQATGVSCRTIQRVMKEFKVTDGQGFTSPKNRLKRKLKTGLDDFEKSVVRETIYDYQLNHVDHLTLKKLLPILIEKIHFKGSLSSLRKVIKGMGFQWTKPKNGVNQKILFEKPSIREVRLCYLRSLRQYREQKRPIIFTDETFIQPTDAKSFKWADGTSIPKSTDQRAMIVHAGYEGGFINNALQIYKVEQKTTGDVNNDLNNMNYETWIKDKLIPNLPPNSVVVFDNAPYHNTELNVAPTFSSRKTDMIKWLSNHNIPHTKDLCKPELYKLIKLHKFRFRTYKIDSILAAFGHSVLRLPSHSPELNPMQMIWASAKEYVAQRKGTLNLIEAIRLFEEAINTISTVDWKIKCDQVREIENSYFRREKLIDQNNEQSIGPAQLQLNSSHSGTNNPKRNRDSSEESELGGWIFASLACCGTKLPKQLTPTTVD